jgi:rhodanese-related sulfurtransferase
MNRFHGKYEGFDFIEKGGRSNFGFQKQIKMNAQINYYENKLQFEMDPADLFAAINNGEKVLPVDARKTFGYIAEHIPGAINLSHSTMTAENTKHLDRDVLYVVYCDGIGCNGSTRGALNMARLGFKVRELIGGIAWWKFDGYDTEGEKATKGLEVQCAC